MKGGLRGVPREVLDGIYRIDRIKKGVPDTLLTFVSEMRYNIRV